MAKVLVSIVSEQTIQNVLFIKHLVNQEEVIFDEYCFLSSKRMFGRHFGEWIAKVCRITFKPIEIEDIFEDDIHYIYQKLTNVFTDKNNAYYVNITGGTKLMSIALYQFFNFEAFPSSHVYYLPAGKNQIVEIPTQGSNREKNHLSRINYSLNVEEYLGAYGVKIIASNNTTLCSEAYIKTYLSKKYSYEKALNSLRSLDVKKKDYFFWTEIEDQENLRQFLGTISFPLKYPDKITKNEISFLAYAGEIEEYVYHSFKRNLYLDNGCILMGVEIEKEGLDRKKKSYFLTDNELDIVFVYLNSLYVVECKRTIITKKQPIDSISTEKKSLNDIIYTLAAIKDNKNGFGLFVNSFLYCHSNNLRFNQDPENDFLDIFKSRAELHNIKLIDCNNIESEIKKLIT